MVAYPVTFFKRLVAPFRRWFASFNGPSVAPPVAPPVAAPVAASVAAPVAASVAPPVAASVDPCPLLHPEAPLPDWVARDPVVQKYRALLGSLPWETFPERPTDRPYPGPAPEQRAPFVAAFLVKLHEEKRYMSSLRAFLIEHPALVYWLGFTRVADPRAPFGFDVAATVPSRRQFGRVLRTLPNGVMQFLLDATVQQLRLSLPPEERETFGDLIAGDTQAILAWVEENNPKQYIKEGRLDKNRQPSGDPDCKLGVKKRQNSSSGDGDDHPAPTTDAKPAKTIHVGVDVLWGYASGVVATRLPDDTEVVLAERTRPFNESDPSYFAPLMAQVEARLGRRPRFGTWDAAYDAHYVYEYFHQAGGFAAVPFVGGPHRGKRQFAADGSLWTEFLCMYLQIPDGDALVDPHPPSPSPASGRGGEDVEILGVVMRFLQDGVHLCCPPMNCVGLIPIAIELSALSSC